MAFFNYGEKHRDNEFTWSDEIKLIEEGKRTEPR